MTAPDLQAAGITQLFLFVSSKEVRSLEIHWDDEDPSNNHLREHESLCDEWDDIEHFLDDEDGTIFLDRKCEVQLTNTMISVVQTAREAFNDIDGSSVDRRDNIASILKLLGQEVIEG